MNWHLDIQKAKCILARWACQLFSAKFDYLIIEGGRGECKNIFLYISIFDHFSFNLNYLIFCSIATLSRSNSKTCNQLCNTFWAWQFVHSSCFSVTSPVQRLNIIKKCRSIVLFRFNIFTNIRYVSLFVIFFFIFVALYFHN